MRKIKDVMRLRAAGLSHRKVAHSLGLGLGSVRNYELRAQKAELVWPDVADVDATPCWSVSSSRKRHRWTLRALPNPTGARFPAS